jgi:hypothetical protein
MIKKKAQKDGNVLITFSVTDAGQAVALISDINGWDASSHPMKKRSNGTRSVSVTVPEGAAVRFRYLSADGTYFDDPEGDALEPNGFGDTHTVVTA